MSNLPNDNENDPYDEDSYDNDEDEDIWFPLTEEDLMFFIGCAAIVAAGSISLGIAGLYIAISLAL